MSQAKAADRRKFAVSLPASATVEEMIQALWRLPRDIVSDGFDAALYALSSLVPMRIHEYPTGMQCLTWIVPEKWTCHEGVLKDVEGRKIFSYQDNPLHVASYSIPFEGRVSREELFKHLHVHPKLKDAVPFVYKYYKKDWALCCSQELKETLKDPYYLVSIQSEFSPGTLKVGEIVAPGRTDECIVLCAHLCHPRMTNDGLSGVVAGIDVIRKLCKRKDLRYTYRRVIVPETIGSAAYLSNHEELVPSLKGGIFLEMLGTPHPHALQRSYFGDTEIDACCELILKECDRAAWCDNFLKIIMNDERMFNSPGIRVPMVSLSRAAAKDSAEHPHREYHSSHDTPESLHMKNLRDSCELVLKIIDALEQNRVAVPRFKGEIFWSRFKRIDYEKMFHLVQSIPYCLDGRHRVSDISRKTGIEFTRVKNFLDLLEAEGLIEWDLLSEKSSA